MSFFKALKCCFCRTIKSLGEVNFPEDLYDLILQHEVDQLLWVCDVCKKNLDLKTTQFLLNKSNEIENVNEFAEKSLKVAIASSDRNECHKQDLDYGDIGDSGSDTSSVPSLKNFSGSPKENKAARKYIHKVLNEIKIPCEEEAHNKQIILSVLEMLVTDLKKDEVFSCVFNKFYYTGSAYEDLRIISATEYDINVVLYLPSYIELMPDLFDETLTFGKIKWKTCLNPNISVSVMKFLEKNSVHNCLSPEMVLSWFQRHLDLFLKKIDTYPPNVLSVKTSSSGPARTIIINTTSNYSISVDLVPVFEFDYSILGDTPIFGEIEKIKGDPNKNKWFMVPKKCQEEIDNVSLADSKISWRLHFPYAEKHILYGKECAKNVIKILKILRDKRNWKKLSSYCLKMVVILEVIKNPSSDFWKNGFVFERTLDALRQLKTYLKNQNFPHFLSQRNLLFKWSPDECINCSNYLNNFISDIESEPETIVKLLLA